MSEGLSNELLARTFTLLENVKYPGYSWDVHEGHGGTYLRAVFYAFDHDDNGYGTPIRQETRKWLLSPLMTDSEIVATAFKCVITSLEHEARERFTYKGARIFGPHFDVNELAELARKGHANGARKTPA